MGGGGDLGVSAAFFLRVVGLVAGCWGDPSTSIISSDSVGTPYFVSILDMVRPCFFFFMAIALVNISCTYRLSLSVMAGLLRTAWQDAMRPSMVSPGSNSNSSTSLKEITEKCYRSIQKYIFHTIQMFYLKRGTKQVHDHIEKVSF